MKAYWISLYTKVDNQENLKKYSELIGYAYTKRLIIQKN